jgi:hypothetical protein
MTGRFTVRVPEDLGRSLDEAADRMQRKRSQIVRLALRHYLETLTSQPPADRVRDLIGSLDSGIPDLAEDHRGHILKAPRPSTLTPAATPGSAARGSRGGPGS